MHEVDKNSAYFDWGFKNNWAIKYHLYCDGSQRRTNALIFVLVLNTLFCFTLLYLADVIGRKKVMLIASFNIVAGLTLTTLMPSFNIKMLGIGIAAGSEGAFSAMFSILINESTCMLSSNPKCLKPN
jgi:MFS family permease